MSTTPSPSQVARRPPLPALRGRPAELLQRTAPSPASPPSVFTDFDLHLFGEGRHWQIHSRLGAHARTWQGVRGVNFAVWAPHARAVSLVGDFNHWRTDAAPMQPVARSGIWEVFAPEATEGQLYKFRITDSHGSVRDKSDPYARSCEPPPGTASRIAPHFDFRWNDAAWLQQRTRGNPLAKPLSVYEVHLGSWRKKFARHDGWFSYRELAEPLADYCLDLGFTHVELLPLAEHPYTPSWGYQTLGYFCPTGRYGTADDLKYFIDHCHRRGLGVIVDWVPAHFPKDGHGLARFDGMPLYEYGDPRLGEHPDWQTLVFDYGRNEVANFLIASALHWLDEFHVDGIRVDAVASMLYLDYSRGPGEWIPNRFGGRENLEAIEFLRRFNDQVHTQFPGVLTIAEESTAFPRVSHPTSQGGLGFDLKWNMGWMNDSLGYMRKDPIYRRYHHTSLTFSLVYAFSERFMLPLSHDEVVHGKGSLLDQMPGDPWQRFANLRLLYSYMWTHPGKKLLFMGGEFAPWSEWDCDGQLPWHLLAEDSHGQMRELVRELNRLYRLQPALHQRDLAGEGFTWIDCDNHDESTLAFLRHGADPDEHLLICCNFTPIVRHACRVGVPSHRGYVELFNSDAASYGGTDVRNRGIVQAAGIESHGRRHSIEVTLPPLGVCILSPKHGDTRRA